jgi:polyferredoxin
LLWSLVARTPLKVDVVRDRAALSRIVAGGKLENVYRLQVMNASEAPQRFRIEVEGIKGAKLATGAEVDVAATESRWVPVAVQIPPESAAALGPGAHGIHFEIKRLAGHESGQAEVREKSTFVVPR